MMQYSGPALVAYWTDGTYFANDWHFYAFWLQWTSATALVFYMLLLINGLQQIMHQKRGYMESLLTMLQNNLRGYYKPSHEMPQINLHNPENLNEIINLSTVLLNNNQPSYERALVFTSATLIMVSIQFLYICLEIIVRKQ